MIDLFEPPTPPVPKSARRVSFEMDYDPFGEETEKPVNPRQKYFTEEQRKQARIEQNRKWGATYRAKKKAAKAKGVG